MSYCNCAHTPPEQRPCLNCRRRRAVLDHVRRRAGRVAVSDGAAHRVRELADLVVELAMVVGDVVAELDRKGGDPA